MYRQGGTVCPSWGGFPVFSVSIIEDSTVEPPIRDRLR